jgi:hypothetical protein
VFKAFVNLKEETAITVIEVAVVTTIFVILLLGLYTLFEASLSFYDITDKRIKAQTEARQAVPLIIKHIRMAENFTEAKDYSLTLNTDIDDDDEWESVSFFLEGTTLKYRINGGQANTLASFVRNEEQQSPIFYYLDTSLEELQSEDERISKAYLVKVHLIVDEEPGERPDPYVLQSEAQLRNYD